MLRGAVTLQMVISLSPNSFLKIFDTNEFAERESDN